MKSVLVGITGGIGSGKSVIAQIFKTLGHPVYDADKEAAKILESDPGVQHAVKTLIGEKAFLPDGLPDRPFIASIVFRDPGKLEAINNIIHPAVHRHFHQWVEENKNASILLKEAAIMFESGSYRDMNYVIAVTCPEAKRIERVKLRDGKNENQVRQIIARQLPEAELIKRSNFEIVNDETQLVIPQVLSLIEKVLEERKS